jgi:hypothetical protein
MMVGYGMKEKKNCIKTYPKTLMCCWKKIKIMYYVAALGLPLPGFAVPRLAVAVLTSITTTDFG